RQSRQPERRQAEQQLRFAQQEKQPDQRTGQQAAEAKHQGAPEQLRTRHQGAAAPAEGGTSSAQIQTATVVAPLVERIHCHMCGKGAKQHQQRVTNFHHPGLRPRSKRHPERYTAQRQQQKPPPHHAQPDPGLVHRSVPIDAPASRLAPLPARVIDVRRVGEPASATHSSPSPRDPLSGKLPHPLHSSCETAMPIRHCIVHLIEKKPDGTPAVLFARDSELGESLAKENMLASLNESHNVKQGKAWCLFHEESGAYPFSGWLSQYMEGSQDFTAFSRQAVEHLQKLMEESNLATGGHVLFAHYQQGMTDYLAIALLHHSEGVTVTESLDVAAARHLDLGQLHLATRINISEWQNNKQSKQDISFIKGKNGKKVSEYFRDFIGCQEGVDGPGETRTLLKAFSDFVENED